jgi:hypothetical protein
MSKNESNIRTKINAQRNDKAFVFLLYKKWMLSIRIKSGLQWKKAIRKLCLFLFPVYVLPELLAEENHL